MIQLATASSAAAREHAAQILAEDRFSHSGAPRPLHGVLVAIGKAVGGVLEAVGDVLDRFTSGFPGGPPVGWLVFAGLVVALAAVVFARLVRRRGAAVERARRAGLGSAGGMSLDPDALEREAADAERTGELERALRLRFRAGLLRLDRARAIEFRPSITTHEVARAVRSPAFDSLALAFEEVAYGGRAASSGDVDAARRRWPELLSEVGAR